MEIRKVQTGDIPKIKAIADSLVITPDDRDKDMGFYDYSLTSEQYQRRSKSKSTATEYAGMRRT